MLSSGIPTRKEYQRLQSEPFFQELLKYSRNFDQRCQAKSQSTRNYSSKWVKDPFLQWSRRWEYVYVAQQVLRWATTQPTPLTVIAAGSGYTFFPFDLLQTNPGLDVGCYDTDPTAGQALQEASDILGISPDFCIEDLERLQQNANSADIVYSISVIEHTSNPRKVIDEINRILKPGGIFVCTFDISFETGSPMHVRHVEKLVAHIKDVFDPLSDWEDIDFGALPTDDRIVTTGWIAETKSSTLPWRHPLCVWLYDLLRGRPRRTLYRPMTYFCGTFIKKQVPRKKSL